MKNFVIMCRNKTGMFLYKNFLKRVFFLFPPEKAHNSMIFTGRILGSNFLTRFLTRIMFDYSNDKFLSQNVLGLKFRNPLSLSAGFDKDVEIVHIIDCVGFAAEEIGSITKEAYEGNPGNHLWRLKKSKSLVVYYGLKNLGADFLYHRLKKMKFRGVAGISIAKTNSKVTCDLHSGIEDYFYTYKKFQDVGDYYTINISCPNTYCGEPFKNPASLDMLLTKIFSIKKRKPVFLKITPDISKTDVDKMIKVCRKHKVDGFIVSNLTKNRNNVKIKEGDFVPNVGGISGKVVEDLSNDLISYIYKKTKGEFVLIGCGGVFSAEDAYKKIRNGASLIHMITGMIFEGPFVISEINRNLCKLLKRDGFNNISEAVGADVKFKNN